MDGRLELVHWAPGALPVPAPHLAPTTEVTPEPHALA